MTKDQAIRWIKEIQNGEFDRTALLDQGVVIPRGRIAVKVWNDSMFSYGMEYGVIMALIVAFEIGKDEL